MWLFTNDKQKGQINFSNISMHVERNSFHLIEEKRRMSEIKGTIGLTHCLGLIIP